MSLKTITILRWFPNKTTKKFMVDIYEDDNLEDGIIKIIIALSKESEKPLGRFYVWNNHYKSILFSISDEKWKGYDYNPLKATDKTSLIIKQPIIYNYNHGLCYFNSLNIIFEDDFPDLKGNQYYFTDFKLTSAEKEKTIIKTKKLQELEAIDTSFISENYSVIHRYELSSKINHQLFAEIYDNLNTSPLIQYIQWINDTYTLIHKLYLHHTISHTNLKNWTTVDKIGTNNKAINCFALVGDSNSSYAKITIDNNMKITINYILDLRKNIQWDVIEDHLKQLEAYLQSSLHQKLTITPVSIKIHNYLNVINVPFDNLKMNISKYPQIFDIISTKETINLIYKRSSNFSNEAFDYSKYIKTRLLLGIDNKEIVEELTTFGLSQEEAKKMIITEEELMRELEENLIKEEFTDRKLNTIVVIKATKNGFETIIHNISNKKEYDYLIHWLCKIIIQSQKKQPETKKKKQLTPPPQRKSSSSSFNESDESLEKLESSSQESSGGAYESEKEKADQRYRIQLLQNADKDLFGENYARHKCQKRSQPFVITEEARQKLIDEGRYFVDNDIYYGSRKDKMNYYLCPRLWCKISKVPADPISGKCPIDDDETILSFFDNKDEEGVKRYVKLIKPNENGICAPCCFKKPPKESELNKCKNYKGYDAKKPVQSNVEDKDENYLVNYPAPIAVGRYGIVPQNLHELLFPTIKYSNCSKDLTRSDKCLVRKGIIHKEGANNYPDSLLFSLAHLLDFNNKKELINDIKKKLDMISFLGIENGSVCLAFMDKLPLIPSENPELLKELKKHFETFPHLSSLYKINFSKNDYQLSRLLGIFKSYKKFISYLSIDNYHIPKSPYYLFSLISNLYNKLLIVWEKENKGAITNIICPYFTSYNDLILSLEINPEVIMLLKDKKYFEPIELKSKGKDGLKVFHLNDFAKLQELLQQCSSNSTDNYSLYNDTYNNLYSLNNWIKAKGNGLLNQEKFKIDTIIINSNLTIENFITKGKILLTIQKIGISFLNRILKDFDIKTIVFYEDLSDNNTTFEINVNIRDLNLFKEKAIAYGVKYDIGSLDLSIKQKEPVVEVYTTLEIKKRPLDNKPIIHTRIEDDLYLYQKDSYEDNKKWFQLQIMVFSTLIRNLTEERLKELISLPRIDYINELMKFFSKDYYKKKGEQEKKDRKIPYLSKIQLILEEVPIYSLNHIKNYLNKLIIYYKYDFLNPVITINKKQFQFSQVSLNNGIPFELLNYHQSSPNNNFFHTTYETSDYNFSLEEPDFDDSKLPRIFKGSFESLNSKWTMHKKSKWFVMKIIKIDDYNKKDFKEFFDWLSAMIKIKTSFDYLQELTNNKLLFIKDNEENLKLLLKDQKLFKTFALVAGKSYGNVNTFYENVFADLSREEKTNFIRKVINKNYPLNDLFVLSMAEILNINILTIHRAIYKTTTSEVVRGDMEDLIISTTLYKAPINHYNRPLIIFYKDINPETNETIYQLVVDSKNPIGMKSIYLKLTEVPPEILILIEEHLKRYL